MKKQTAFKLLQCMRRGGHHENALFIHKDPTNVTVLNFAFQNLILPLVATAGIWYFYCGPSMKIYQNEQAGNEKLMEYFSVLEDDLIQKKKKLLDEFHEKELAAVGRGQLSKDAKAFADHL